MRVIDGFYREQAAALQLPVFEVDLCDVTSVVDHVH